MSLMIDNDWAPIRHIPDYVVSSAGCVMSYKYGDWRELNPYIGKNGYAYVNLRRDGQTVRYYIHRLVAEAFILNPENKPAVNHINGDKLDNRVENLKWVTYQENSIHAFEHGLSRMPDKDITIEANRTPVRAISLHTGEVMDFYSQAEAAEALDITRPHINKVLKGECPHAKGYWFKYLGKEDK